MTSHVRTRRIVGSIAVVASLAACSSGSDVADVRDAGSSTPELSTPELPSPETSTPPETMPPDTTATPDTTSTPDTAATPDTTDTETPEGDAPFDDPFVYAGPDGDFEVTFPGEPTSAPLPVDLPDGQVTAEALIFDAGTEAYFTSAFDYPEGLFTGIDAQDVLVGARDGALANAGGTLRDSEFVELDGIPGIRFTFDVDSGGLVGEGDALVYFDEPRLYQTFALGESEGAERFTAFVDTFTFTGDS